jgi:hypothetical protein
VFRLRRSLENLLKQNIRLEVLRTETSLQLQNKYSAFDSNFPRLFFDDHYKLIFKALT